VSAGGLAGGLVTLFLAFLVGMVAGRVARYNGGFIGLPTALWFLLPAAAIAGIGAWLGNCWRAPMTPRFPRQSLPG
jgi:hypothetical protein